MESQEEVIEFKRKITAEAPRSAARVKGIDKIFYLKSPGNDAILSGSGTVTYRKYWGSPSIPTRYGGVIAADKALRAQGYRPTEVFFEGPGGIVDIQTQHRDAAAARQQQQTVFNPVDIPKISKKAQPENYYGRQMAPEMNMSTEQPTIQAPIMMRQGMQQSRQRAPTFIEEMLNMEDPLKYSRAQKRDMFSRIFTADDFASMAQKSYSNVQKTASQLQVPGFGKVSAAKGTKKGKKGNTRKQKTMTGGMYNDSYGF